MGTRSDYYVGRGEQAEWLGSKAWDGYPSGVPDSLLQAKDEESYRQAVATHIAEGDDGTTPDQGWPWPWNDSRTTDYAYAFEGGQVWASPFGYGWFKADGPEPEESDWPKSKEVFPDMSERKDIAWDKRSGLLFGSRRLPNE